MKTIVLALDALEYTLIEKWKLEDFHQRYHGTYKVEGLEAIATPICFSTILTGRDPRTFGYTLKYIKSKPGYPSWLEPLFWLRKTFLKGIKEIGFRNKASKTGLLTKRAHMSEKMKRNTIFHKLGVEGFSVFSDNVPSYDEAPKENYRGRLIEYIGKDYAVREDFVRKVSDAVRTRWMRDLQKFHEHDLTFVYFPLPDIAHHLVHRKNEMMLIEEIYRFLRDLPLLFELKDVAILIMSDHGYRHIFDEETGRDIEAEHTNVGFWSLNVKTYNTPKGIFDFHDLIYELVTK